MYISSSNSFAASWLLCLIIPFYSEAEKSEWVPYEVNPVHYEFRPIQSESILLEKQFRPNVPKSPQYNVYPKYNSIQPEILSKDRSESNVKLNMARSMPEPGEVRYRPYYYSQFVENRRTSKEKSAEQLEREETREIDEEIMKKMNMLDKMLSEDTENDVEKNTVEDGIITEMNISEETKRVVRQVRRHRPGFFWTLARLAFETYNDTRSAVHQISNFINQTIEPDPTTRRSDSSRPLIVDNTTTTIAPSIDQNNTSSDMVDVNATTTTTSSTTTTTTEAPFSLTSTNLQNLIRRNLRGLVRLFNIEWQDALNQSEVTVREFQKDLGNQIGSFLQDNPNAF